MFSFRVLIELDVGTLEPNHTGAHVSELCQFGSNKRGALRGVRVLPALEYVEHQIPFPSRARLDANLIPRSGVGFFKAPGVLGSYVKFLGARID